MTARWRRRVVTRQYGAGRARNGVMSSADLKALEARIDELIAACEELRDENRALREQQSQLMAERAGLIEKSELARSRVEAMIARLKAMELGA